MSRKSKAGERAAALTRQLLAFSRKQILQPKVLDLNSIVTDISKILQRVIGEDVNILTVLDPHLSCIEADAGQLEQVLMNLAVNARDAMPGGGKLTIQTANVELSDDYAREHPNVPPGLYVMLAISDTGCGMDATTRAQIFEPFSRPKRRAKALDSGWQPCTASSNNPAATSGSTRKSGTERPSRFTYRAPVKRRS
jgi:signal transduction histidine kinase